jgi:hypothetical protein
MKKISIIIGIIAFGAISYFALLDKKPSATYSIKSEEEKTQTPTPLEEEPVPEIFVATHIKTPESVKALYMSSWVAGTSNLRNNIVSKIDENEINAVVIDIKDYTGRISYIPTDPYLLEIGSGEARIRDIREFIELLHKKNIYVIGRLSVFQDKYLVDHRPELAVKKASDKNSPWRDRKGISWLDAGSMPVWEYTLAIALDAYAQGFDEINFDYIRFPSDGNMKDIYYPVSEGKIKHEVMKSFFAYLDEKLHAQNIPISADLFGMTATNYDDLGIGQVLEDALPHFDFIAPMVYPSHYPATWNGIPSPAKEPYKVIYASVKKAGERAEALGLSKNKIRPWLQDFNLGATYTAEMVRAQITATYDAGLNSWMMWDAGNTYTYSALKKEGENSPDDALVN